jgi:hypothetical protein
MGAVCSSLAMLLRVRLVRCQGCAARCMQSDGVSYSWLCRDMALHLASERGHTETALALVEAGADVHCKDKDGYNHWLAHDHHACVWVAGRHVRPLHTVGWRFARVVLSMQQYRAAPCVEVWPHRGRLWATMRPTGDRAGASRGGCGHALQER